MDAIVGCLLSIPPGLSYNNNMERLNKFLAHAGLGSRRQVEELIVRGRVSVNGSIVRDLATRVESGQEVAVDGKPLHGERSVYWLVNKPPGYLCTNRDPAGRPLAIELVDHVPERVFTVGRLDEESEGLLLLTNDGDLAYRLMHPRFGFEKTYRVQVAGKPTREDVDKLLQGVWLSDGHVKAQRVKRFKSQGESAWLEIVLSEGKNREIRRMLARLGHKVLRLQRVALGPIRLDRLPKGKARRLKKRRWTSSSASPSAARAGADGRAAGGTQAALQPVPPKTSEKRPRPFPSAGPARERRPRPAHATISSHERPRVRPGKRGRRGSAAAHDGPGADRRRRDRERPSRRAHLAHPPARPRPWPAPFCPANSSCSACPAAATRCSAAPSRFTTRSSTRAANRSRLDVVYLVVGKLTGLLAGVKAGEAVEVWGPLGNGFPRLDGIRHVALVAGGIGQTPFLAHVRSLLGTRGYGGRPARRQCERVSLYYGVRRGRPGGGRGRLPRRRGRRSTWRATTAAWAGAASSRICWRPTSRPTGSSAAARSRCCTPWRTWPLAGPCRVTSRWRRRWPAASASASAA